MLVEFKDGHEFDTIDSEVDEVRNSFAQTVKGARMSHPGRRVTGETSDMQLVDDQFGNRKIERPVVFPVEVVFRNSPTVRKNVARPRKPAKDRTSTNGTGERIKQDVTPVETMPSAGIERPLHAVTVFNSLGIEIEDHHGKDVAHPEFRRERNLGERA